MHHVLALVAAATLMPAPVTGDFDHDGKPDQALIQKLKDGSLALVVVHGNGGRSQLAHVGAGDRSFFLKIAAPGEVAMACSSGSAPAGACPGGQLQTGDTLAFGTGGESETVALWTGRQFAMVPIGD